jgi:hypothetical protein
MDDTRTMPGTTALARLPVSLPRTQGGQRVGLEDVIHWIMPDKCIFGKPRRNPSGRQAGHASP